MGADIVVGEGQSIGVGLQFGGPYVGLFATREKYVRQMPGRLAGETVDAEGKRGFVLTLSTREQHIRREKATSNICTSSVLCALAFTMHMTLLGEKGLRQLAALNHAKAVAAAERLARVPGVEPGQRQLLQRIHPAAAAGGAARRSARWPSSGMLGGVSLGRLYPGEAALENGLVVAVTETVTEEDVEALRRRARGGAGMTINQSGWRPTAPEASADAPATFTGNRALMLEEPLIFEIGDTETTGVDFAERRERAPSRLGGPRTQPRRSASPASPSRRRCAITPASAARITRSTSACSRSARAR